MREGEAQVSGWQGGSGRARRHRQRMDGRTEVVGRGGSSLPHILLDIRNTHNARHPQRHSVGPAVAAARAHPSRVCAASHVSVMLCAAKSMPSFSVRLSTATPSPSYTADRLGSSGASSWSSGYRREQGRHTCRHKRAVGRCGRRMCD